MLLQGIIVSGDGAQPAGTVPFQTLVSDDGSNFPSSVTIDTRQDVAVIVFSSGTTGLPKGCLLYTSPSPRDRTRSRMPSSA